MLAICLQRNPLPRGREATVEGWGMRVGGRVVVCLALAAAMPGRAAEPNRRWPLDLPPVLTSTFSEYRAQHLHAGIDLATGGRVGAPCYAVGDGSIVRLRMSPYGYGKALYLQLDAGPLVVYAHLSRFAPAAAARARAEQESLQRYSFDLNLPPAQLRVRRGDIVAWSGQTGVGVPHLHFELRDGDVARNPQTAGFAVTDAIAPTIEAVRVHPLDGGSHVEGETAPKQVPPANGAPLRAGGRLAFSVRAWDAAARDGHRQGPYRLELRVDGNVLYRSVAERFDYATNHLLVVEYDQERLVEHRERDLWLWRRPGNRLEGREDPAGTGGILQAPALAGPRAPGFQAAPGPHTVEVEVADVAGNTSVRRFSLVVAARPSIPMLLARDAGDGWRIECRALDADLLVAGGAVAESLSLGLESSRDGGEVWEPLPAVRAESDHRGLVRWTAAARQDAGDIAIRARVRDRTGLEAVRTWTAGARQEAEGELAVRVRPIWRTHGLELDLEADDLLEAAPTVYLLRSDGGREPLACTQRSTRAYRGVGAMAALAPGVDAIEVQARALDGRRASFRQPLAVRIVRRGERARVRDLDPRLEVDIAAGAALDDVALRIGPAPAVDLGLELRPVSAAFSLEPRAAAFDRAVRLRVFAADGATVAIAAAGGTSGIGLFGLDRSGALRFLSAERDEGGAWTAETRFLGALMLLSDTTAPSIGTLRVARRKPLQLAFTVLDRGADLGDGGITAKLDGEVAIPEWDPETGVVVIEPVEPLAVGAHTLEVVASDRVGNRAERRFSFPIP